MTINWLLINNQIERKDRTNEKKTWNNLDKINNQQNLDKTHQFGQKIWST